MAEVVRGHGGPPPESLDSDKNFILLLIKISHDLRTFFEIIWKKKCLFGLKTVFLWQEVHYCMVYIAYFTQICKFAITRKNDAFVAKIVNTRLTKFFHTSYLSREPREFSCKFFLAGVNCYRFNAKIGNLLCILP